MTTDERRRELYNMIKGIPARQVYLDLLYANGCSERPPRACSAIACIAGWAWIYPPFIKAGIRRITDSPMSACEMFFNLPEYVFYPRQPHERGSEKTIALLRIKGFLE